MMNTEKFKIYGKFKMFDCIVEITNQRARIISTCQMKAQLCAKYLYEEGFVDADQDIEFEQR